MPLYKYSGGLLKVGGALAVNARCCCSTNINPTSCTGMCIGNTPANISVTIAGVHNNMCSNCAPYNGTFVLTPHPTIACMWQCTVPNVTCCTANTYPTNQIPNILTVWVQAGTNTLKVEWFYTSGGTNCQNTSFGITGFQRNFDATVRDCMHWNNLLLNSNQLGEDYNSPPDPYPHCLCSTYQATCHITTL